MHLAAIPAPGIVISSVTFTNNISATWNDADAELRKWNLWSYIDARDGAQAVRRTLERDVVGSDVYVIANADTVMSRSSAELVAEVFLGVEVRKELDEHVGLFSIDKARRDLGFEPECSWRESASW